MSTDRQRWISLNSFKIDNIKNGEGFYTRGDITGQFHDFSSSVNYKTTVNLHEGVKKTFDYIKKRGTKPFEYNIKLEINNDLTPEN